MRVNYIQALPRLPAAAETLALLYLETGLAADALQDARAGLALDPKA